MSFVEIQFPTDISYGSTGGPEYFTNIVASRNGYEQRNRNWSLPRARYNVAHGIKTQAQLDELIAFFRARGGMAEGFRFKDWVDYQATGQILGEGDADTTSFQLIKRYISGNITEIRTLSKPVAESVSIYLDSVLQVSGYTVNTATGMVSFTSAPAEGAIVSSDCEFDVPVRFDTDRLIATMDSYGSHSWLDIPLVEIRI